MSLTARQSLLPAARRLLKLASEDRKQARDAMAQLPPEAQVAAICESPLELRRMLLDLCEIPEQVVPHIPPAELCFIVKSVGLTDAGRLLEHASDADNSGVSESKSVHDSISCSNSRIDDCWRVRS